MSAIIRSARPDDAATIATLIRELAAYEKIEHEVKATPEAVRAHLFGPRPFAEAILAELDGESAGFVLFYPTYSTFPALPGVYVEDLFVRPAHRGGGIGTDLLAAVAGIARERGCGRMSWAVLDWNSPSIGFYRSLGARPVDGWTIYRLDGGPFDRLAARGVPLPRESLDG